jgi:hypothetical protein
MTTYSKLEGLALLAQAVYHHSNYPQGQPIDISITLSDEQWNAVAFALQACVIAQSTEGNALLPEWLADQIHEALHVISGTTKGVLATMFKNEADEIVRELREDAGD